MRDMACRPEKDRAAQGPRSGPAALPATRVLAASQTGQSALGLPRAEYGFREHPGRAAVALTPQGGVGATLAWPRRQSHGAVEKPSVG